MIKLRIVQLALLALAFFSSLLSAHAAGNSDTLQVEDKPTREQSFNRAWDLLNRSNFIEARKICDKAILDSPDNALVYYTLAAMDVYQIKFQDAIRNGEKAIELNPKILEAYQTLFTAYLETKEYTKAEALCEKALLIWPKNQSLMSSLSDAKKLIEKQQLFTILMWLIIFSVVLVSCYMVFKNSKSNVSIRFAPLDILLVSSSLSLLVYHLFYYNADYIWSLNLKMPDQEFTPAVRSSINEHDGIESYVLYASTIFIVFLTYFISQIFSLVKSKRLYLFISLILLLVSTIYYFSIKFVPPVTSINFNNGTLLFLLFLVFIIVLIHLIDKYLPKVIYWTVSISLLLPICFIATDPISILDYSYVLSPALRLLNGFSLSEIYFQYDLFLSLLAALWMKLQLNVINFQVVGRISFFLFFLGVLLFSKKYFYDKKLAFLLVLSLVIIRFYAIFLDPVALFQVTPIRLDLWLILVFIAYYKGVYHWITGISLGLLLVLHRNFGSIYLISYLELIFTLFCLDLIQLIISKKTDLFSFKTFLRKQLTNNYINLSIVIGFFLLGIFIFKGFLPESAILYQKVGIGMFPTVKDSFFWYIPILFSLVFVLLIRKRSEVLPSYFNVGLFIVFLAIGNSMYFLGRSHEHNILNISGIILVTLFLLFDLLGMGDNKPAEKKVESHQKKATKQTLISRKEFNLKKAFVSLLPILLILGSGFFYSARITGKISIQQKNFSKGQFVYPLKNLPTKEVFSTITKLTQKSKNVYFLDFDNDFPFYYYGNYIPQGYFSPCMSWVLNKDLAEFLQTLLDQNYNIVISKPSIVTALLSQINYNKIVSEAGITVISKENVELAFPSQTQSLVHVGVNSDLKSNGIYLPPVKLGEVFSISLLIKPDSIQNHGATIFDNTNGVFGTRGIMIKQTGNGPNNFLFSYGTGLQNTWGGNNANLKLLANKWNYIVITGTKETYKIYNNGQLVFSDKFNVPLKNNDEPLVLGNRIGSDQSFRGLIKEVMISNDLILEKDIFSNLEILNQRNLK